MTNYIVPFTEIRVLSYEVEASSKHEAAMKVGAARERNEDCNENRLISTRMRPIVIAPEKQNLPAEPDLTPSVEGNTFTTDAEPQLTPPRHTK